MKVNSYDKDGLEVDYIELPFEIRCGDSYITNDKFIENLFSMQPERLNPEARKGCDSPNTPTKGSESTRNE